MAQSKFFYLFILLGTVVSFISCSEEQDQEIDQQYLDSQEYSSFKENTDWEIKKNSNSENLAADLVKISDCNPTHTLETPFLLDWDMLEELNAKADQCNIEQEGQQLTLLAEQSLYQQTIRWYLLEPQSAYRDAEVIVATFNDNKLRSFTIVGMYEKIPAHNIQTKIRVNRKGNTMAIRSETIRDIKYPLEQKNTITANYEINASGGINEL